MTPATSVGAFKLDRPDETGDDVLRALRVLGDSIEIPRLLVRVLADYMRRYTDPNGTPVFSGSGYFDVDIRDEAVGGLSELDVVDSFSTSVALSLATIGFVRVFRDVVKRPDIRQEIKELEAMASRRLTAAMVGLLRSFTVSVFDAYSPEGRALCRTANQGNLPDRQIIEDLRDALREINASLRDVTIGSGSGQADDLDNPNRLFECGWSWGIAKDAPTVQTVEDVGHQPAGVAQPAPYLYFTVVALDGIAVLFSERTRLLGLLNEEQTRLAQALQLRWELTQSYWYTIATFGSGRWPLEDLPWRTTDGEENDYFSLLVTSIVVQDLVRRRSSDADDLRRVGEILAELAHRGRITRRPFEKEDAAIVMHSPGVRIDLGTEKPGDIPLAWMVSDFSPLLLERTLLTAALPRNTELRGRLLALADQVWDHLLKRRIKGETGSELWDQPANVFPAVTSQDEVPSWYYTRRVTECLVTAAELVAAPPVRDDLVFALASSLISEAEHRFDQELLSGSAEAGPSMRATLDGSSAMLRRGRDILAVHPGTAFALASKVLRELDKLAAARQDVSGPQ